MSVESMLTTITWDAFVSLPLKEKVSYLTEHGKPYHILAAQQFDRAELDSLGDLATRCRMIAKSEDGMAFLLRQLYHKRAMLYFTQPSSRTFLSFSTACHILGIPYGEVRDTATSSELKGESKEDSIRTFSSYFDLIIMRSEIGGLAERMAWVLSNSERPIPVINAGSGQDQHPTQALLDVYTLQRSFENRGGIDGKTIVFVGDLRRGRTVRSLSWALTNYKEVKQIFAAPKELQIGPDILTQLDQSGVQYQVTLDFKNTIPEADAIYMTRIQDEWDSEAMESKHLDTEDYHFTGKDLKALKKDGIVMHPLPRRKEISADVDSDPRAMYWRQMRNGMWIRAALIASIFNCEDAINEYAAKNGLVI
jgi:aspartate carbamoyltransferase catalytic subunit